MTDIFVWSPAADDSTVGTTTLRVLKAQFGDGYGQTVVDGINANVGSWTMNFTYARATICDIEAFIDAHIGQSFFWTPQDKPQGYYQCDGYQRTAHDWLNATTQATFYQVFRP